MTHLTTGIDSPTPTEPTQRRWSRRRRLFVWTVGIVVIGGMIIAVLLPSLCRPRESANRIKCESNLRQIGQAIAHYAQDNGGQYPPSLGVLVAHEGIAPSLLVCPSASDTPSAASDTAGVVADIDAAEKNAPGHKYCLSYVYIGRGLTIETATAKTVVVYEPLTNHDDDGAHVLFGDGHVDWIDKQSWPKIAATLSPAANPMPTTR